MNKELLQQMIDQKLVNVQKHPTADLYIHNYAAQVQYSKAWNEITLQTRGLILDGNMNVVAKPFGKFFNLSEHTPEEIPNEPFEVFDKCDGSLGILYWVDDTPYIATRGSFTSDQAIHATNLLHTKYKHLFDKIDRNKTHLFEIIYPENQIVCWYNGLDDLILLTVICNKTGAETLPDIGFTTVKRYNGINNIEELKAFEEDNKEGFVIRFKSGFRVKLKFDEYVRLHRIITQVSNIVIWEYLCEGKPFDELLERVPDEFYSWLKQTKQQLTDKYDAILHKASAGLRECHSPDKKTFALAVLAKHKQLSGVIFAMYNKKDHEKIIWKMCRPVYSKPFKNNVEN